MFINYTLNIIMDTLQHTEYQVSALNDLIRINNDRITGYKKRIDITPNDDLDLADLFSQFIYQSRQNIYDLIQYIYLLGGKPADGTSLSGKFYYAWMDFKSAIYRQDRKTMLDYCEYGEDVAKSAYQKAFDDKEINWGQKVVYLLKKHLDDLKKSHELIKELQDDSAAST
ncbi:MAG: family four-helix-bundle protein [Mucilaginibacter sp.]|jgi:uncharacterized protein (TIGR02284 family)|nr:family four-helix-bundle protein [Mucilaginibacter sp.]